jgi:hypothetical protein
VTDGVGGLRVCDASLMATVPCATVDISVLLITEKDCRHDPCRVTLEKITDADQGPAG